MSRFATQADMTADEITDCSYDLLAILRIAEVAAIHLHDQHSPVTADALGRVLSLAVKLHAPIHDAMESHEDLKGIAPARMTAKGEADEPSTETNRVHHRDADHARLDRERD